MNAEARNPLAGNAMLAGLRARVHSLGRNLPVVDAVLVASPVMHTHLDLYADEAQRELLTRPAG